MRKRRPIAYGALFGTVGSRGSLTIQPARNGAWAAVLVLPPTYDDEGARTMVLCEHGAPRACAEELLFRKAEPWFASLNDDQVAALWRISGGALEHSRPDPFALTAL